MKKIIILTCVLLVMFLNLVACNADNSTTNDSSLPFTTSASYYELSGDSKGYAPAGTYDFDLSIRNDTDEEWTGACYVFLIDRNGPILDISNIDIYLPVKGDQVSTVIKMTLPADIEPGAYGLAVLLPGKGHIIQTIYVGDTISNEPAGSWPDISSYKQIRYEGNYEDHVTGENTKWIASAHTGDMIWVTLDSNPTTGFNWSDKAEIENQNILKQLDHEYITPDQAGAVGTPGKEVWTFKALNEGTTTFSMEYRRSWENNEEPERIFTATITVE